MSLHSVLGAGFCFNFEYLRSVVDHGGKLFLVVCLVHDNCSTALVCRKYDDAVVIFETLDGQCLISRQVWFSRWFGFLGGLVFSVVWPFLGGLAFSRACLTFQRSSSPCSLPTRMAASSMGAAMSRLLICRLDVTKFRPLFRTSSDFVSCWSLMLTTALMVGGVIFVGFWRISLFSFRRWISLTFRDSAIFDRFTASMILVWSLLDVMMVLRLDSRRVMDVSNDCLVLRWVDMRWVDMRNWSKRRVQSNTTDEDVKVRTTIIHFVVCPMLDQILLYPQDNMSPVLCHAPVSRA